MRSRARPRLRLEPSHIKKGFMWRSNQNEFDPSLGDPLFTIWCTVHDTRDEAIDYYNKVLEDFNANSL